MRKNVLLFITWETAAAGTAVVASPLILTGAAPVVAAANNAATYGYIIVEAAGVP
jgi:hypothetical protein